jgi:hypothetical protein
MRECSARDSALSGAALRGGEGGGGPRLLPREEQAILGEGDEDFAQAARGLRAVAPSQTNQSVCLVSDTGRWAIAHIMWKP